LQGLEHVGQTEDFGKINIFAAMMLPRYQTGLVAASYQEAVTMELRHCMQIARVSTRIAPFFG
jgi:hypothetical protein